MHFITKLLREVVSLLGLSSHSSAENWTPVWRERRGPLFVTARRCRWCWCYVPPSQRAWYHLTSSFLQGLPDSCMLILLSHGEKFLNPFAWCFSVEASFHCSYWVFGVYSISLWLLWHRLLELQLFLLWLRTGFLPLQDSLAVQLCAVAPSLWLTVL